jgi:hypothetical protein
MKKEDQPIKQTENIPSCFEKAYCHIRRFMKDPIFNSKTAMKCNECIHDNPNNYPKNFTSWQVVNISNGI